MPGTAGADVRLREPQEFFRVLEAIRHRLPPLAFDTPAAPAGWLAKEAGGCGGWQVRGAPRSLTRRRRGATGSASGCGAAMSATFVGNGRDAVLLGVNRRGTQALGRSALRVQYAHAGPVVAVGRGVRRELTAIVRPLTGVPRCAGWPA